MELNRTITTDELARLNAGEQLELLPPVAGYRVAFWLDGDGYVVEYRAVTDGKYQRRRGCLPRNSNCATGQGRL